MKPLNAPQQHSVWCLPPFNLPEGKVEGAASIIRKCYNIHKLEPIEMNEFVSLEQIDKIAGIIRSKISQTDAPVAPHIQPQIGLILGSGLGKLAAAVEQAIHISHNELPGWPISTVKGHQGELVFGKLEGQEVLVMQGRSHYYEGYSIQQIGLPVRVMQRLGIKTLIVTNAAGAVNSGFQPGELMLIVDHLNLIGMAGLNPLRGPNLDELGPRFPDMSQAYDRQLCALARKVAHTQKLTLREGVYAALSGPSFESPAELRFLKAIGVDAVGMSTVPEVIVARHGGMRVLGISGISNKANLDGSTITTHEEVLEAGHKIVPQLLILIRELLRELPQ
jgi:purine-nucleoside phosphorylase